jgi:predicted protein tyrosine phosphatase
LVKKILFVCSANKQRSKTAEDYFSNIYTEFEFYSAGTNLRLCQKEGTNPLTESGLQNANLILVMETKHKNEINKQMGNRFSKKIEILNIPDNYKYFQIELLRILDEKVKQKFLE